MFRSLKELKINSFIIDQAFMKLKIQKLHLKTDITPFKKIDNFYKGCRGFHFKF